MPVHSVDNITDIQPSVGSVTNTRKMARTGECSSGFPVLTAEVKKDLMRLNITLNLSLEGKFATVKLCTDKKTGVEFAAKIQRRRRKGCDSTKEILSEAAMLELTRHHAGFVGLVDVYESNNDIAIITDFARGGELCNHLLLEGSISEPVTQRLLVQILDALSFIHDRSLVHMDIKPQNILLTGALPEGDIKLCDLGLARFVNSETTIREIIGTPDYVAPEVLSYEPLQTGCDIWSVGVLAYVMLTGCSPFTGDTKQETFLNISQVKLDFPEDLFSNISSAAIDFIKLLLVREPADRPTARECLQHEWLRSYQQRNDNIIINTTSSSESTQSIVQDNITADISSIKNNMTTPAIESLLEAPTAKKENGAACELLKAAEPVEKAAEAAIKTAEIAAEAAIKTAEIAAEEAAEAADETAGKSAETAVETAEAAEAAIETAEAAEAANETTEIAAEAAIETAEKAAIAEECCINSLQSAFDMNEVHVAAATVSTEVESLVTEEKILQPYTVSFSAPYIQSDTNHSSCVNTTERDMNLYQSFDKLGNLFAAELFHSYPPPSKCLKGENYQSGGTPNKIHDRVLGQGDSAPKSCPTTLDKQRPASTSPLEGHKPIKRHKLSFPSNSFMASESYCYSDSEGSKENAVPMLKNPDDELLSSGFCAREKVRGVRRAQSWRTTGAHGGEKKPISAVRFCCDASAVSRKSK